MKSLMLRRLSTSHPASPTKTETANNELAHRHNTTSRTQREDMTRQIDQQFSQMVSLSSDQTGRHPSTSRPIEEPRVHRVAREKSKKKPPERRHTVSSSDSDSDVEFIPALVQPLQVQKMAAHSGLVHRQKLEDTTGVVVGDKSELLVPKRCTRPSIEVLWDTPEGGDHAHLDHTPPVQSPRSKSASPSPSPSELLAIRVRSLLLTKQI